MNSDKKRKGELSSIFQTINNNQTKPLVLQEPNLEKNLDHSKTRVHNRTYKKAKLINDIMIPRIVSKRVQSTTTNKYQFYLKDDELANYLDAFMRKNHLKPSEAMDYIIRSFFHTQNK